MAWGSPRGLPGGGVDEGFFKPSPGTLFSRQQALLRSLLAASALSSQQHWDISLPLYQLWHFPGPWAPPCSRPLPLSPYTPRAHVRLWVSVILPGLSNDPDTPLQLEGLGIDRAPQNAMGRVREKVRVS